MAPHRLNHAPRWLMPALAGLVPGLIAGGAIAAVLLPPRIVERPPDPARLIAAVHANLRAQGVLNVLTLNPVAVVTAESGSFLFATKRILVMPGRVRYLVDLRAVPLRDVRWNAAARRLVVVLPPLALEGPAVDVQAVRTLGEGGLLSGLVDAAQELDAANLRTGQNELVRQAHDPQLLAQARSAARRLVRSAYAAPLSAAGVPATIDVRFADDPPAP